MRSLVIYYSHRGTTAYIARRFYDALKAKGDVDMFELKYIGAAGIFIRFLYRLNLNWVNIVTVPTDLRQYDAVYLGVSVLGGYPSAAISKYITLCTNLTGKKIICCYTYGLEASVDNCRHYVEKLFRKRGSPILISTYVPWYNVFKEGFLEESITSIMRNLA